MSFIKICIKCNIEKDENNFGIYKNGYKKNICNNCIKKQQKEWHIQNKDYIKKYNSENYKNRKQWRQQYYQLNKDIIIKSIRNRRKNTEYKKKQYEHHKCYYNNRYKTDLNFKLRISIRHRLRDALKSKNIEKSLTSIKLLGCSIQDFKKYLESKFTVGMSWSNYGKYGWHIDHIKPCSLFNLTDIEQQKICFHYTNLQPLWAEENLKKGNRYNELYQDF